MATGTTHPTPSPSPTPNEVTEVTEMQTDLLTDPEEFVASPSFAQERLWVMEQLEDDAATYNIQLGLRLRGRLDIPVLQRTLDEILRRHEVLRTRLALEDGELVQLIAAEAELPVRREDLQAAPDGEAAWQQVAESELRVPFDVAVEPPVRATLVRLAGDQHILLITLDHLACDARSLQVLHAELVALYPAFAAGAGSPLPELPIQYADYAAWQRDWLDGEEQRQQLDHWRARLGDDPPRLDFHRRTGPRDADAAPGAHLSSRQELPQALVTELEELARRQGASLFSVLLSTFGVLLSRYGCQEDFVVGSLLSGRTRPELEDLVGFFVNTVGLRLDLRGRPTFAQLLARVHDVALDAYAHQDVPFEQVARSLGSDHMPGHSQPFFDVMFQLADLDRASVRTPELTLEPLVMASEPAPVDLVVAVLQELGGHTCVWDYSADLFTTAGIERMQRQFLSLLRSVAADPDRPLAELAWMTPAEAEHLLAAGRGVHPSPAPAPAPEADADADADGWTFVRHFDAVVRRSPDATALSDGVQRLTYRELDARANRMARALAARSVGPDTVVGILLERSIDQTVAVLATLKAGGAYLPLDPAYPAERIGFMVSDAAPPLVITTERLAPVLTPQPGTTVLCVERLTAEAAATAATAEGDASAPTVATRADHLAYVIYTSGSTGRPKGTGVPHRGMRVVIDAHRSVLGLTGDDRVLHFASSSFDASVFEMLMAFGSGAALHIAPTERGVPVDLTRFLQEEGITALVLPPSALAALVEDAPLPVLRVISVAGEACPPSLAARFAEDRRFFNLYGPTEATIWSTWHRVTRDERGAVPIGRPLPGIAVHLLDEDLRPVPEGVPGELCVSGPMVARGYLGRPSLTAERFVPDPFGDTPGGRLYRTGDLARWNDDGELDFLGRMDAQVKIRGFRIELGEIESTVAAHPGIREAVAVVREDTPGAQTIVAYAVARGAAPDPDELRELCARRLPAYMVPAQVVLLDRLPVTGAGKLDRKALPAPGRGDTADRAGAAPEGPLEEAIAEIWAEVLGVEDVRRTDDFFALGGNSLSATQVIVRVRADFELALPVRTLFDSAGLSAFTEAVRSAALSEQAMSEQ